MTKGTVPATTMKGELTKAFEKDMEAVTPYLQALIPYKGGVEQFKEMTLLAILRKPDLLTCNRRSLLLALIYCAQKGLEPEVDDGAWLVPFKGIVVPVPAYKGLIKKAVETESAKDVDPIAVYEKDDFSYSLGMDPAIHHKPPPLGEDRGKLIGAYCVVTLPDGTKKARVLDRPFIEKIRASSAAWKAAPDSGPWFDWEEAMFLKTGVKQGLKYIPVKPVLRDLLRDDSRLEAGEAVATLIKEGGLDLSEDLGAGPAAPEPPEENLDFDLMIKDLDDVRKDHLKIWLDVTAKAWTAEAWAQKPKGKPWTVAGIKASCVKEPAKFWKAFDKWEAQNYPAKPQAAPSPEVAPLPAPGTEGQASQQSLPDDKAWKAVQADTWRQIEERGIPLDEIAKVVKCAADITPENIEQVKWIIKNYQEPKGK